MRWILNRWVSGSLCTMLMTGAFFALWYHAASAPDDAVREITIGSHGWYLAEHRVGSQAYYTLRSGLGNTPWDGDYGNRPASLLCYQLGEEDTLLLQRLDGSVLRIDLRSGSYAEIPPPSTPPAPLSSLFPAE